MKQLSRHRSLVRFLACSFCLLLFHSAGPACCSAQDSTRTWVDSTGNFKIEASFGGIEKGQVVLNKSDGGTVKLPLDKLSDADQQWVLENHKNSDPFASPSGDSPTKNSQPSNTPSVGKRGEVEADTSDAVEIGMKSVSDWFLTPDAAAPPPAPATEIDITMPDTGALVGTQAALSRSGELAVFSNDVQITNKYTVINLSTGQVLGTAAMESYSAPFVHDISPDGMNLICGNRGWAEFSGITVKIVELRNGKPQERINWECHPQKDAVKTLHYCQFVDNERLITCNRVGTIGLWDFRFGKLIWWFDSEGPVKPAMSANGKFMVTLRNDRLIVIDIDQAAIVATVATRGQDLKALAISPDGTKIAGAGQSRVQVWDFKTGSTLFESEFPGVAVTRMYWPNNRYFQIDYLGTSMTFDTELQVPVSRFKWELRADFLIDSNLNVWYWNPTEGMKMHLIPAISAVTEKKLVGKTSADFMVLPAGSSVRLEFKFQNLRSEIQESIRRDTERAITNAGFSVSNSASKVIRVFAGIGDAFQDESGRTGRKIDFALPSFQHSKTQFVAMSLYDEQDKAVWHSPGIDCGEKGIDNGNYFACLELPGTLRTISHMARAKPIDETVQSNSPFGGGRDRTGGFGRGGFGSSGRPPGTSGGFDKDDKDDRD